MAAGSVPHALQLRLVEGLKAAGVRSVAAGGKHFACLAQTGELYMWGSASQGQLGLGDCIDVLSPKVLRPVPSKAVQAVRIHRKKDAVSRAFFPFTSSSISSA